MADQIFRQGSNQAPSLGDPYNSDIQKAIDEIAQNKAEYKALKQKVISAATQGHMSLDYLMMLFTQQSDAWTMGVGTSSTLGITNAFLQDWHKIAADYTGLTSIQKYSVGMNLSTTADPTIPGQVKGINSDGTLNCTNDGHFSMFDGGKLKPGLPFLDLSGLGISIPNANPLAVPPQFPPAQGQDAGAVALQNQLVSAGQQMTTAFQGNLLGYIDWLRGKGGPLEQLQALGVDTSGLSVLNDFDDAVASSMNIPMVLICSTGDLSGPTQSMISGCQQIKNTLTSQFGTSEAGFNGMVTQAQTTQNKNMGLNSSILNTIVGAMGNDFSGLRDIISSIGK